VRQKKAKKMSVTAYKRTISHTEEPRQIERRILASVTSRLEVACEAFDSQQEKPERLRILADGLREILWENQRIWLTFKADLAEAENGLSAELRAALISLSLWVETHTKGVLAGSRNVQPLIDINRNIIDGLGGRSIRVAAE
jgi:flagellar biosynthesis activator protein FlaF|tara:strand:- start:2247 stop:2672 length:426 start_codon:yes stop_codon:yes gene_type:complete